ncbi:alpha-hydroxy-acid oxidizing protein [Nocardia sp. CDC159]|uniref:Alpha-hydroxy-acid oxidizing protein n=1 Tax=Nocardia pulmonis TaxID=2951408 RepID=A0A9X2IYQ4_9NOCA|nr:MULTISPECIES: alpha-hydroxy acid oxidase [Nocardia]MCM6776618.1 alpha-hydroxy-acid oxidizing protein [Nocardia pulmonis]MCM6789233.1 alpha-hydroxy-acid oxidizing protein [Nocardia sp. CDC159]
MTDVLDDLRSVHSIDELRCRAEQRMPADIRDFVTGGSESEQTLAANRAALDGVRLVPRVMVDVDRVHCGATLFGRPASAPMAVAPMAYQRLVHPDGELASARAAAAAGIPFTATTLSSVPVEWITATGADTWFQLYWLRDRALMRKLIRRAEAAGCAALILTVDAPVMGRRLRDMRNGFAVPDTVRAVHLPEEARGPAHLRRAGASAVIAHTEDLFDPGLCWSDLGWLRDNTRLPLVLKGVLDSRDAALAAAFGIDAVIVSNHGGRQLDGAISSIDALPGVVEAVDGNCEVLLDSGIRCGTDVLRALALGARAVLIGRPVLWGLTLAGADGVEWTLSLLRQQLHTAMRLAGCPDLASAANLGTRTVTPSWDVVMFE